MPLDLLGRRRHRRGCYARLGRCLGRFGPRRFLAREAENQIARRGSDDELAAADWRFAMRTWVGVAGDGWISSFNLNMPSGTIPAATRSGTGVDPNARQRQRSAADQTAHHRDLPVHGSGCRCVAAGLLRRRQGSRRACARRVPISRAARMTAALTGATPGRAPRPIRKPKNWMRGISGRSQLRRWHGGHRCPRAGFGLAPIPTGQTGAWSSKGSPQCPAATLFS